MGDHHAGLGARREYGQQAVGLLLQADLARWRPVAAMTGKVGCDDLVPMRAQTANDLMPAPGAVPGAMNENDTTHALSSSVVTKVNDAL